MLTKRIEKKGNSNYILIPKTFLQLLNLKEKDEISISFENDKIIISPIKKENEV
jgi:antitoxin component of MazEF toxin-antitoxin module